MRLVIFGIAFTYASKEAPNFGHDQYDDISSFHEGSLFLIEKALTPLSSTASQSPFNYSAFASAFTPGENTTSCESSCCVCVQESMPLMMGRVESKATDLCKTSKCPFMRKMCEWGSEHAEEWFGVLIQMSNAPQTVLAYCTGKGVCTIDEEPDSVEGGVGLSITIQNKRRKCMQKAMKWVMARTGESAKNWCKKTTSPYWIRVCDWASENPKTARGMLWGKVQPWKYASGWCARKFHPHTWTHQELLDI